MVSLRKISRLSRIITFAFFSQTPVGSMSTDRCVFTILLPSRSDVAFRVSGWVIGSSVSGLEMPRSLENSFFKKFKYGDFT